MTSRRQPPRSVKIFVALVVPLLLLGLLELGARLAGAGGGTDAGFGQFEDQVHLLLRRGLFERDSELFWRLRPVQGLETHIAPGGLRVNSLGLRGPELPRSAAPGVVRVATLGDSCTFGWGVSEEQSYPSQLGRQLRERGLKVEMLNGGIPGYTSHQALRLLRRDLLPFGPGAVVFYFGWNELWPARGRQDVSQAVSGWLVQAEELLDRLHLYRLLRRLYVASRSDLGTQRTAQTLPRVSPDQFRAILEELVALCRQQNIELVLVLQAAHPTPHRGCWSPPQHQLLEEMYRVEREVAARHGVPLIDSVALLHARPAERTFIDCIHPSAEGYGVLAAGIADALEPRLRAR